MGRDDEASGRSHRLGRVIPLFFLCVIDRMSFQPVLIAHLANVFQSSRSRALSQMTALPDDSCAKADSATEQSVSEGFTSSLVSVAWVAAQHANAGSNDRRR